MGRALRCDGERSCAREPGDKVRMSGMKGSLCAGLECVFEGCSTKSSNGGLWLEGKARVPDVLRRVARTLWAHTVGSGLRAMER